VFGGLNATDVSADDRVQLVAFLVALTGANVSSINNSIVFDRTSTGDLRLTYAITSNGSVSSELKQHARNVVEGWAHRVYSNQLGGELEQDSRHSLQLSQQLSQQLSCPPGKFSGGRSAECASCAPGQFSARSKQQACLDCPRGKYRRLPGSSTCDSCPAGKYVAEPKSTYCHDCPTESTSLKQAVHVSQCFCSQGFYDKHRKNSVAFNMAEFRSWASNQDVSPKCYRCPDKTFCNTSLVEGWGTTVKTIKTKTGYWRATNSTTVIYPW
jgi:hypothetical protein